MPRASIALALAWLAALGGDAPDRPGPFVPTDRHAVRTVEGWTVRVHPRLLPDGDRAELGARALRLLETKLYEVGRVVPPRALERLRGVTIWLGVDDGHAPCAEYHPSRDWLAEHGYNPDKAGCVEIGNAERFLAWSLDQPMMVFHELAHAYHHQVLGYGHRPILEAHRKAVAGGTYDAVLHFRGERKRAYALVDPQEFFAEASEAYFGSNDFYPFVRAELEVHDPEAFRVVAEAWNR